MGALGPATALITHEEDGVKNQVSCFLSTMAASPHVRAAIRKPGANGGPGLSTLADMVTLLDVEKGPICNENAAGFFAYMCSEFSSRAALAKNGGLTKLVELLKAVIPDPGNTKAPQPTPDLLRNLARAVLLCMEEYDARAMLGELQAIESVFVMLKSDYNEVQSLALDCVCAAARNSKNREIIRIIGGMECLITYLQDETFHATHEKALKAFASVLQDPEAMALVSQRGPADKANPNGTDAPITSVIKFIGAADHETAIQALGCVTQASANAVNRRRFMDQSTESAVSDRLWSDDAKNPLNPRVGLAAINATAALARSPSNAEELAGAGVIPKLAKLLLWDDEPCKTAALRALAWLALVDANRLMILEAEALPKIIEAFESGIAARMESAAEIIFNVARSSSTRDTVLEADPLPGVVKCVASSDVAAQTSGCKAVAVLMQVAKCQAQIMDIDGATAALVAATRHGDSGLRQAALRACRAAAVNNALATKLCDDGALEAIKQNSLSVGTPSKFATTAFEQLLDHNLSAKYAFRNELRMSDVIRGVFFDSGRAKDSDAFRSLADLSAAPVNGQRAVLLVDANSDEALAALIADTKAKIDAIEAVQGKVTALAEIVAERMGGAVASTSHQAFKFELVLSEYKQKMSSNVVPLGLLNSATDKGVYTYYHRALLFKVLADQLSLPTALVRSEYNRAYNVVYLAPSADVQAVSPYVVDVTHSIGTVGQIQDVATLHLATNFFENYAAQRAVRPAV